MELNNSLELLKKANSLYPALTGTFSRAATSFLQGVYPVYAKSANGAYFTDVDDNTFLDLVCSFGPISLGHNYSRVNEKKQYYYSFLPFHYLSKKIYNYSNYY